MAALTDALLDLSKFADDIYTAIQAADEAALQTKLKAFDLKVVQSCDAAHAFWKKMGEEKVKAQLDNMTDEGKKNMFEHYGITTMEEFYLKQGVSSREEFETKALDSLKDIVRNGQFDADEDDQVALVQTCCLYYGLRKALTTLTECDRCEMLAEDGTWEKGQIYGELNGSVDLKLDKDVGTETTYGRSAEEIRRMPKTPEVKAKLEETLALVNGKCDLVFDASCWVATERNFRSSGYTV